MTTNLLVPRLGEGVDEVIISKWLKQVGDKIQEMDPLVEVNTDKVDTEIPSPASGILLEIKIQEGLTAKVGEVLALIGESSEQAPEAVTADGNNIPAIIKSDQNDVQNTIFQPSPMMVIPARSSGEMGFISPVVAKMASEFGLNLSEINGTGLGGRITKNDVISFMQNRQPAAVKPTESLEKSTIPVRAPIPINQVGDTIIKHTLMRKSIAEHMLASKQTSPHVLTVMEADLSKVSAHRALNKSNFAREGLNLTYTAYFMMAIVAGLKAFPLVNSSWSDEGVIVHAGIHLGMATSLGDAGLIVPVIRDADRLSLLGMTRAVNDLATRARARKLQPDEVKGGTFTLTNHGVSGSLLAMPIINQPQSGILGMGALQKRVVVVNDALGNDVIAIRPMVYLSFVFDHRILDGASADWFLAKVKDTLEKWGE